MGLWEQIVNGKVKKCIDAELIYYVIKNELVVEIVNDFIGGKIIFNKDYLSFQRSDKSHFCIKTPYLSLNKNGYYVYQETDIIGGYTFQFLINPRGTDGTYFQCSGDSINTERLILTIDLKFNK